MALWFAVVSVMLAVSLLVPLEATALPELRAALMLYALGVVVMLIVLGQRVTAKMIHVQICVGIAASLLLVASSGTSIGAITSSNSLIIVAAYVGFWLARTVALSYVAAFSVGLLAVFAEGGYLPELLIPWMFVTTLSVGLVITFGTLVRQLNRQLVTDPLTGLLNRAGLFSLVDLRGEPARLAGPRCIMVIDLDDFKSINDCHGHLAGDRILRDFGTVLRAATRPEDVAIRSGGDEFVLLLPQTVVAQAEQLALRLRGDMPLEWSYGVTEWMQSEDIDVALARADAQMYRNKARRSAGPLPSA